MRPSVLAEEIRQPHIGVRPATLLRGRREDGACRCLAATVRGVRAGLDRVGVHDPRAGAALHGRVGDRRRQIDVSLLDLVRPAPC